MRRPKRHQATSTAEHADVAMTEEPFINPELESKQSHDISTSGQLREFSEYIATQTGDSPSTVLSTIVEAGVEPYSEYGTPTISEGAMEEFKQEQAGVMGGNAVALFSAVDVERINKVRFEKAMRKRKRKNGFTEQEVLAVALATALAAARKPYGGKRSKKRRRRRK